MNNHGSMIMMMRIGMMEVRESMKVMIINGVMMATPPSVEIND